MIWLIVLVVLWCVIVMSLGITGVNLWKISRTLATARRYSAATVAYLGHDEERGDAIMAEADAMPLYRSWPPVPDRFLAWLDRRVARRG